jgi:NAD(P)-dependent dehydrogenase (short-subunit alcohol dehydrogenase family)
MDLKLNGKRALVTGSTAGIGAAIAAGLAREGARVIVNGRAPADVEKAVATLKVESGGEVIGFAGDLGTARPIEDLVRRHPEVDILVNNLGIFEPKPFEDIPDADWMRFFEVNVLSGVRLSRAYLPAMKRANWGRIIFISSESALQIPAEMIHYGVTKTAQIAVARGLAEAVAGTGITVNSVLPGPTKSRGVGDFVESLGAAQGKSFAQVEKEFFAQVRPTSLIKRFAAPQEVASLVAYVASPLASATTGAALRVDGGVVKSAF